METKAIVFTEEWTDAASGRTYAVGEVAVFDVATANRLIADGKGATGVDPT